MQLRISPGGRTSNSRRNRPELPPSSVTVTTAVRSACFGSAVYRFKPCRRVESPVPPPMDTMRSGSILNPFQSEGSHTPATQANAMVLERGRLVGKVTGERKELLSSLVVVFFCVHVLELEIVRFKHLITFETADIIDSFSSRQNLSAVVGTHARITLFYALPGACQGLVLWCFCTNRAFSAAGNLRSARRDA